MLCPQAERPKVSHYHSYMQLQAQGVPILRLPSRKAQVSWESGIQVVHCLINRPGGAGLAALQCKLAHWVMQALV